VQSGVRSGAQDATSDGTRANSETEDAHVCSASQFERKLKELTGEAIDKIR
jgi:hypothetical protein